MEFLNRKEEMGRLQAACKRKRGAFIVVWGRRRVGKTRLLLEWIHQNKGAYWVANESVPPLQRKNLAQTLAQHLPGFDEAEYADWGLLFKKLAREIEKNQWKGPLVIDEFPYLVATSPELPSILQQFIDHDLQKSHFILAIAGSSQRMMQGLVLDSTAPLYGRAQELIQIRPIEAPYIKKALNLKNAKEAIEAYSIWGGIPRYWELAEPLGSNREAAIEQLVLNPLGVLHQEPKRLLLEENPSAMVLKPLLDAIGMGAHRLSEIAARLGESATSLAYALTRLQEMDLIEREIPFGASEKSGKKALYKIKDPFFRFWFTVVGNKLSLLASSEKSSRLHILREAWPTIVAQTWEDLCRKSLCRLNKLFPKLEHPVLMPAKRFWQRGFPEWDVVSQSFNKKDLIVGEAKWTHKSTSPKLIESIFHELQSKGLPPLGKVEQMSIHYCVFVPEKPKKKLHLPATHHLFDANDILQALLD